MQKQKPRFSLDVRRILLFGGILMLSACTRQLPSRIPPSNLIRNDLDYVDLRAGWRVRVVVPILRTGGYIVPMTTRVEGSTISVQTGKDFVGCWSEAIFQRSHCRCARKSLERTEPAFRLFSFPPDMKFARLVYLVRESESDHDMVVLAAADEDTLRKTTAGVKSGDSETCKSSAKVMCVRIPAGIAVVPEERIRIGGQIGWKPVR